jgi:hypothetical protein
MITRTVFIAVSDYDANCAVPSPLRQLTPVYPLKILENLTPHGW